MRGKDDGVVTAPPEPHHFRWGDFRAARFEMGMFEQVLREFSFTVYVNRMPAEELGLQPCSGSACL